MKLVVISAVNRGKEYVVQEGNNLIGRWDPDDKSFPEIDLEQEDVDAKISRRHCVIVKTGEQVSIEDIGSLNGTFVNETHKLTAGERHVLKAGDQILVGKTLLRLDNS